MRLSLTMISNCQTIIFIVLIANKIGDKYFVRNCDYLSRNMNC